MGLFTAPAQSRVRSKKRQGKGMDLITFMMVGLMLICAPTCCLMLLMRKHGTVMSTEHFAEARISDEQVDQLMQSSTMVHIGGPHRGGTSLVWSELKRHPDIAAFTEDATGEVLEKFLAGGQHQRKPGDGMMLEGIYLQSVYPTFGMTGQSGNLAMAAKRVTDGFGRYALLPEAHMLGNHSLVTEANGRRLFRQWARYWDLEKTVFMEKTPPNIIWTQFLEGMFPRFAQHRYITVTRHPLAVSLAHRKWTCCRDMALYDLVHHWIVQHEIMLNDIASLKDADKRVYTVQLEQFVTGPERYVGELIAWLGLDPANTEQPDTPVQSDPNEKYRTQYASILATPNGKEEHAKIVDAFEERLSKLPFGYSLKQWSTL